MYSLLNFVNNRNVFLSGTKKLKSELLNCDNCFLIDKPIQ